MNLYMNNLDGCETSWVKLRETLYRKAASDFSFLGTAKDWQINRGRLKGIGARQSFFIKNSISNLINQLSLSKFTPPSI